MESSRGEPLSPLPPRVAALLAALLLLALSTSPAAQDAAQNPTHLLLRLARDAAPATVDQDAVLGPTAELGRAPHPVDAFIEQVVQPIRARYAHTADDPDVPTPSGAPARCR